MRVISFFFHLIVRSIYAETAWKLSDCDVVIYKNASGIYLPTADQLRNNHKSLVNRIRHESTGILKYKSNIIYSKKIAHMNEKKCEIIFNIKKKYLINKNIWVKALFLENLCISYSRSVRQNITNVFLKWTW